MSTQIPGAVVVITGASSGIARATALELAREGAHVVLASRQEKPLKEVVAECERLGGRALLMVTDVTDEGQVQQLARRAVEHFGHVDVWINAAAVTLLSRFEEAPSECFRRVIDTNLFGSIHAARAILPHFRERNRGTLINISSVLGKAGSPYASAYVASKFAVAGFSESLRMEYQSHPDIHICTVFPATIDTPLFQKAANYTGRAVKAPPPVYSPERAAEEIVQCIRRPRREVYVGNTGRMAAMRTLAPSLAESLFAKKMDREHFADRPAAATKGNLFDSMPEHDAVHGGWAEENGHPKQQMLWAGIAAAGVGLAALFLFRRRLPIEHLRHVNKARRAVKVLRRAVSKRRNNGANILDHVRNWTGHSRSRRRWQKLMPI